MQIKSKSWIEDKHGNLIFGGGKTELLEIIGETGSISEASKRVGMNYKKALGHVQLLQNFIVDELVISHKGGRNQGGTELTEKAKDLIGRYKKMEEEIEAFANKKFNEYFLEEGESVITTKDVDEAK